MFVFQDKNITFEEFMSKWRRQRERQREKKRDRERGRVRGSER